MSNLRVDGPHVRHCVKPPVACQGGGRDLILGDDVLLYIAYVML